MVLCLMVQLGLWVLVGLEGQKDLMDRANQNLLRLWVQLVLWVPLDRENLLILMDLLGLSGQSHLLDRENLLVP